MAMMRHGDAQGFAPLRYWLATQFESDYDQFIIGNGSINLLALLTEHHLCENDVVLVENSTYYWAKVLFESVGTTVISITLEADGLDTDLLVDMIERHAPVDTLQIDFRHWMTAWSGCEFLVYSAGGSALNYTPDEYIDPGE
jgi:DNA-binding transcriptional MocR family regulator